MKKLPIKKKSLNDFTALKVDSKQQKKIKGGDDTVIIDDIII